jgi:uncharacterized protein
VALEQALLDILVCPVDKGGLLYFADEKLLYNPRLRRSYQIRDDVPLMLAHQAETLTDEEHARLLRRASEGEAVRTRSLRASAPAWPAGRQMRKTGRPQHRQCKSPQAAER